MCDYCSWIEKIVRPPTPDSLPITICTNVIKDGRISDDAQQAEASTPTILVHGNGNSASREENDELLMKLEEAAVDAYRVLVKGTNAVDATELVIRKLESQDTISYVNQGIKNLMRDAIIMDSDSNSGSVGAVINVNNPITLAKKVLLDTDHVLIVGDGVQNLATEPDELFQINEGKNAQIDPIKSAIAEKSSKCLKIWGALARDREGRLSCGISTLDARPDVIARSAMTATGTVPGCGIFADSEFCCSVSGPDNAMYLHAPARRIVERLEQERESKVMKFTKFLMKEAVDEELDKFFKSTEDSSIGIAVLGTKGEPCVAFEASFFPWACCNSGVVTSGCTKGEVLMKDVKKLEIPRNCECH